MYYLFDLDGTITDSNGIWVEVDTVFLARRGLPYTEEYAEAVAHSIFPIAAKFTKDYCGIPDSEEEIMAEWMALAGDRYSKTVALKPFAREFLEQCRARGVPMSLVTACVPEHCRAALQRHDLAGYFEHLIFAQELGIEKADPRFYRETAKRCGAAPADCVLFDDSIRSCRSAMTAGMRAVGVYDDLFRQDETAMRELCSRYITSFQELLAAEEK
ncbi:MAG: HAD family hydrolase [Oscillospiraceae bacterium]